MTLRIKDKNGIECVLSQSDFLAQGGEGSVYVVGKKAYKIYEDSSKIILPQKIHELSKITYKNIIIPQGCIWSKGDIIGYEMDFVPKSIPLCKLFNRIYRDKNNISHQSMQDLILNLRTIVEEAHKANTLIVDLNEMNIMSDQHHKQLFAIDVDSWQTPSFKATAIMDSIRDYHSHGFHKGSDWYSFGILAFQMFIGIHPFKGKHKIIGNLDDRMKKMIPCFDKSVSIPSVCYDFNVIPKHWMEWFQKVFTTPERLEPPMDMVNSIVVPIIRKNVHSKINYKKIHDITGCIGYFHEGGKSIVVEKDGYTVNKHKFSIDNVVGITVDQDYVIAVSKLNEGHKIYLDGKELMDVPYDDFMAYNNELFFANDESLFKASLYQTGKNHQLSIRKMCSVSKNRMVHDGCILENMLGMPFIVNQVGSGIVRKKLDFLKGHRIIAAKSINYVTMITSENKGQKFHTIIMDDIIKTTQCDDVLMNFTVLNSKVCLWVNNESELELFNKHGSKVIQGEFPGDHQLISTEFGAGVITDSAIHHISIA